jgi:hypothetical protein
MRALPRDLVVGLLATGPLACGTAMAEDQGAHVDIGGKFYYLNKFDLTGTGAEEATGQPRAPREIDLEIKRRL